jgi:hypothetical protein
VGVGAVGWLNMLDAWPASMTVTQEVRPGRASAPARIVNLSCVHGIAAILMETEPRSWRRAINE